MFEIDTTKAQAELDRVRKAMAALVTAGQFSCNRVGHNYGGTNTCGKCGTGINGEPVGSFQFSGDH